MFRSIVALQHGLLEYGGTCSAKTGSDAANDKLSRLALLVNDGHRLVGVDVRLNAWALHVLGVLGVLV